MPQDRREAQHRTEARAYLSPEALARVWAATATQLKGPTPGTTLRLAPVAAALNSANLAAGAVPVLLLLIAALFILFSVERRRCRMPGLFPASPVLGSLGLHATSCPLICLEHHARLLLQLSECLSWNLHQTKAGSSVMVRWRAVEPVVEAISSVQMASEVLVANRDAARQTAVLAPGQV